MKRTIKKSAACVLSAAMVLSMAACGSGSSDAGSTGNSGAKEQAAASADGKPTITFMSTSFYGTDLKNEHSEEVIK
ncbi:MAG: hypothetical protein Q4F29_10730, partial [Lachnospiraceae bacterium]|nr:hypothetical protein [Lachnospiraceae bacterium]